MKRLMIEVDGEKVEVLAQKIKGKLWVHYNGRTFEYTPEEQKAQSQSGAAALDPSKIAAPMPGKVIKILKKTGDKVSEGETVVVLEAMKMEYNLKASQEMVIKKISCEEGQNVALGDLLISMEEN